MIQELRKEQHDTESTILCLLQGKETIPDLKEIDEILFQKVSNIDKWNNMDYIDGIAINLSDKSSKM